MVLLRKRFPQKANLQTAAELNVSKKGRSMKIKLLIASILSVFLLGCSGDPYEKYIGYWKKNDAKYPQVLQISKDGETYLLNNNVFQTTDFAGNKKKPSVLKKSENQLSVENGMGSTTLGLSGDSKTLHAANMEYTKISESEFEAIKSEVEAEKKQKETNTELCKKLNNEYDSATKELENAGLSFTEKGEKLKVIVAAFKEKAKDIPKCNIGLFW